MYVGEMWAFWFGGKIESCESHSRSERHSLENLIYKFQNLVGNKIF
jgi:hypothetical protein